MLSTYNKNTNLYRLPEDRNVVIIVVSQFLGIFSVHNNYNDEDIRVLLLGAIEALKKHKENLRQCVTMERSSSIDYEAVTSGSWKAEKLRIMCRTYL